MNLVPIPPEYLGRTYETWVPFVERIAKRRNRPKEQLIKEVTSGMMHLVLACDDDSKAQALAGVCFKDSGNGIIAEWKWMTGSGREHWVPLLPQLEQYLKEHQGCSQLHCHAREGWWPTLKKSGYRKTHIIAEKVL